MAARLSATNTGQRIPHQDQRVFDVVGYSLLAVAALVCLIPMLLIVSASLTDEVEILRNGYTLFPRVLSSGAYALLFGNTKRILSAYLVSIVVTATGTLLGTFLSAMTAYVLSRKDFPLRNYLSFFMYFTTLFSGGLVPQYILVVRYLRWKNSLLALIVVPIMVVWFILILRAFMQQIPESMTESARVDGAGDFTVFFSIVLPASTSGLATVALFMALNYWNDWFHAMLYMEKEYRYPLQYLLYTMLNQVEFLKYVAMEAAQDTESPPAESMKMATAVVATGPIVLAYPFVQRYFVKGLSIGAVKG